MVEGRFGDRFYVGLKGEGGVQDDAQVTDLRGWTNGCPVYIQHEVSNLLQQRFGGNHELCFNAVQFEPVRGHPVFDVAEAVHQGVG